MEQMFATGSVREAMDNIASLTVSLRELVGSLAGAVATPSEAARELQVMESLAQVAGYGQLVAAGTAKQSRVEQLGERGMAASREQGGTSAVGDVPDALLSDADEGSGRDDPGSNAKGSDAKGPETAGETWTGGAVYMDTGAFMVDALRITGREARGRLAFAAAVLPRPGISGPALPPACPTVSIALAEGRLGTGIAGRIVRAVRKAAPSASRLADGDELLAVMEETTAVLAATATPVEVSKILAYWLERFEEDTEPDERTRHHFEGVFDRGTRHGLREFLLRCLPEDSETLRTVMNLFTNPRTDAAGETESRGSAAASATASEGADPAGGDTGGEAKQASETACEPGETGGAGSSGSWKVPAGDPWDAAASDSRTAESEGPGAGAGPAGTDRFCWSAWAAGAGTDGSAEATGGRGTRAQQMLRGLLAAMRAALAGGGMPQSGGLRPQLMVHIDYATLTGTGPETGIGPDRPPGAWGGPSSRGSRFTNPRFSQSGFSQSRGGSGTYESRIPAAEARRLACEGDILPVVLSGAGEILDLGRSQRLFTAAQRKALAARDRGCAFPGCGIPAAWAEAHHIVPWQAGGGTDIANGVLLCGHHHRVIHRNCWSIDVRDGIPWFLPPNYIDPARTLRRNLCHHPEAALQPRIPTRGPSRKKG